jgi:hypothetical protein
MKLYADDVVVGALIHEISYLGKMSIRKLCEKI